ADALRQASPGALRVLACHHPLIEMIGAPMTGEVKRGERAARIFADAGVDLIVTGHVHVPFALPVDVGDNCSYAVGCGTLSHRERGAPPSFNRIEWDEEAVTVSAVAWDGRRFADHQTWRLPGRRGGDLRLRRGPRAPVASGARGAPWLQPNRRGWGGREGVGWGRGRPAVRRSSALAPAASSSLRFWP